MSNKTDEIGYYSLIQYCPDETRGEVANIGILLFAPKTRFVDVRVTPTSQRVAHIFGGGIRKYDILQRYKEGLSEWVKVERRRFADIESAKRFLAANANTIVFTPLRATVCPNGAAKRLESLFDELLSDGVNLPEKLPKIPRFSVQRVFKTLRTKYGKDIDHKLAILPQFEVVGLETGIQPAFGFQNEHFNVVFPQAFNSERCAEQIGCGLLISNEMKMSSDRLWRGSIPVILGRVASSSFDLLLHISETFKRHKIPFYGSEQALIDYVGAEAKMLPDYAAKYAIAKQGSNLFRQLST